jgi:uncharacterized lipoprotein YmbA
MGTAGDPVPPGASRAIQINVRRFDAEPGKQVVLVADWSLIEGQTSTPPPIRSESITVPLTSKETSAVVSAMSHALAQLSDRIAAEIPSKT